MGKVISDPFLIRRIMRQALKEANEAEPKDLKVEYPKLSDLMPPKKEKPLDKDP